MSWRFWLTVILILILHTFVFGAEVYEEDAETWNYIWPRPKVEKPITPEIKLEPEPFIPSFDKEKDDTHIYERPYGYLYESQSCKSLETSVTKGLNNIYYFAWIMGYYNAGVNQWNIIHKKDCIILSAKFNLFTKRGVNHDL